LILGAQVEGEVKDQDNQQRKDEHRTEHLAGAELSGYIFGYDGENFAKIGHGERIAYRVLRNGY
jgi:hypothetical protein